MKVLGITWPEKTQLGNEEFLLPKPVIERANLGSLREFILSDTFKESRPKLRDKLKLCTDVLHGLVVSIGRSKFMVMLLLAKGFYFDLKALHENGVCHLDIKLENTLVSEKDTDIVGDWIVKICDFDLSEINPTTAKAPFFSGYQPGTNPYRPPELLSSPVAIPGCGVFSIDIWCWGMLLWMVLMNGERDSEKECIHFEDGSSISDAELQEKKLDGSLKDFAQDSCKRHLRQAHKTEHHLLEPICELLARSLQLEPSRRATSGALFTYATQSSGLEYPLSATESTCYPIVVDEFVPPLDVRTTCCVIKF